MLGLPITAKDICVSLVLVAHSLLSRITFSQIARCSLLLIADFLCVEFEKAEWQKAFGDEPLLPKLSRQEIANIRQIIEFNREKLAVSTGSEVVSSIIN